MEGAKIGARIALFGGTFDPPHRAHLALLNEIQDDYQFDKIYIIPSRYPPGKTACASYEKRLEWTKQLFVDPPFEVSEFEKNSSQTIFARDIYYHLSLRDPDADYFWILGEDQWQQLSYWTRIDEYASKIEWILLGRSRASHRWPKLMLSRRLNRSTCRYQRALIHAQPNVSSTEIRNAILSNPANDATALDWIPSEIKSDVLNTYESLEKE